MPLLNKEQIKELLPHREPFLLIDEVIELDAGKKCVALTYIKEDDFWFKGHFPEYPVTPGVLMLEMLAQTGGVCAASLPENQGKIGLFAKIDNAKFRRPVVPGDVLTLSAEVIKMKFGVCVCKAVASVGDEVAVTAELTFAFQR